MHRRKQVIGDRLSILVLAATSLLPAAPAVAAASLNGQVLGAGAPIANSTVTLWAASAGTPKRLAQAPSGADGRFTMPMPAATAETSLYLIAQGGQPTANKTGDQISPPGGYVGGGLQLQTDIAVGPAGDVWAINNWQDIDSCYAGAAEALSTRCGGQGVVIFVGMAKPVRAPQIGPARPL